MHPPHEILHSGDLPNELPDARLIEDYAARGGDVDRIVYLSLGETWSQVAPGLARALRRPHPPHVHGYLLSPYGLPALREAAHEYIVRTHRLDAPGLAPFDTAVSQGGTRAAMSDFGRLLAQRADSAPCTALVPSPGWDYAGVFRPLGCAVRRYHLRRAERWQPVPAEVERLLSRGGGRGPTLLVLNAQHNPTGTEWAADRVRSVVRSALRHRAAILLDDAYYAVHAPDRRPTDSLRILLEEAARAPAGDVPPWLAVRTFGKQFHCNGWGIGAQTAHPRTLHALAAVAQQRTYGTAVPLQHAMAHWLADPASEEFVRRLRHHYADARRLVQRRLTDDLGFPPHTTHPGTCTSYLRFSTPRRHVDPRGGEHRYRALGLQRAGVLLGAGDMSDGTSGEDAPADGPGGDDQSPYVRVYLGLPLPELDSALTRLARADLGW
ncbi:pyridoxal phosphate-dependent aminotransferase [Streptomyces sp. TRM70308]|uniref:pyridoxal phosphate-dependent aminotransferase n=1 Tax=Streptomyces sp. TRM70308 TaxID=3131932 RepID=UPI003D025583